MRMCGIEIKSSDAIIVVLDGLKDQFEILDTGIKKFNLKDTSKSDEVQIFTETIHTFLIQHKIDIVGIKKRNAKGQFAGGSVSFKIEGLIQLTKNSQVKLIAPASISSTIKKNPPPSSGKLFAYQKGAFETAYTLLQLHQDS